MDSLQVGSFAGIHVPIQNICIGMDLALITVLHLCHLKHKGPSSKETFAGINVNHQNIYIGMALA